MITASAADTILASPVISVILGGVCSGVVAMLVGVFRVLSRLSLLETQIASMGQTLQRLEKDVDVIKWGAVAGANIVRQNLPLQPGEQQS